MDKLIIENRSSVSMEEALLGCREVIKGGRVSNNNTQYCYGMTFTLPPIAIFSDLNKKSDKLTVVNYP